MLRVMDTNYTTCWYSWIGKSQNARKDTDRQQVIDLSVERLRDNKGHTLILMYKGWPIRDD